MNYTECKMPDLSDCSAVRLQGWSLLHAFFLGDPGVTSKGRLYRRNFARLVDKSIYEYQMSRKAVLDEIAERQRPYEQMAAEGRPMYILGFTDHFENCLNSVNRALNLFERLRLSRSAVVFSQD
ncbi:MAG TPA: hypothetical protein VG406_14435 [Isosphaeraceae bacterium]|jgi:hypothetical protein|nr:hypothetical protein [Isosphaeraceae bacterium]